MKTNGPLCKKSTYLILIMMNFKWNLSTFMKRSRNHKEKINCFKDPSRKSSNDIIYQSEPKMNFEASPAVKEFSQVNKMSADFSDAPSNIQSENTKEDEDIIPNLEDLPDQNASEGHSERRKSIIQEKATKDIILEKILEEFNKKIKNENSKLSKEHKACTSSDKAFCNKDAKKADDQKRSFLRACRSIVRCVIHESTSPHYRRLDMLENFEHFKKFYSQIFERVFAPFILEDDMLEDREIIFLDFIFLACKIKLRPNIDKLVEESPLSPEVKDIFMNQEISCKTSTASLIQLSHRNRCFAKIIARFLKVEEALKILGKEGIQDLQTRCFSLF
ncbi:unnamed protein product [Moneuplotes crassus]|uniref:Uncharacterized protein n=1 Tax=Euplotes crassus TaxID=5936 RepID=A0AAD1U9Y0_EUPCR|nr:unnamed protein product [Moneuplotes crassus]